MGHDNIDQLVLHELGMTLLHLFGYTHYSMAEAQQHIQVYAEKHYTIIRRRKPLWCLLERV